MKEKSFLSARVFFFDTILLAAALLVAMIAAEGFLRIFDTTPRPPAKPAGWAIIPEESWIDYHSTLGWFPKKNVVSRLVKGPLEVPLRTNADGFRGSRVYPHEKPQGIHRICAAGDSFTFGFGVRDDEAFPAQLETRLISTEVLNLGVPGYGVDQIVLASKEICPQFAPDVMILTLFPEDFWRALRAFNDAGHGKPYFTLESTGSLKLHQVPVPPGKQFSVEQFPEILHREGWQRVASKSYVWRLGQKAWGRLQKKIGREDPDTTLEWLLGRTILKNSAEWARSRHLRFVLVIAPPLRWITGTVEPVRASMLRFAEREKIEIIDLTPFFMDAAKQTSVDDYYIPEDQHWTARGHQLVAEVLADYFKRRPI